MYKRQRLGIAPQKKIVGMVANFSAVKDHPLFLAMAVLLICLLYTSDAADERSSVDLGGRRIIKKKKKQNTTASMNINSNILR